MTLKELAVAAEFAALDDRYIESFFHILSRYLESEGYSKAAFKVLEMVETEGYWDGFESGRKAGYESGYEDGYEEGQTDGYKSTTLDDSSYEP